MYTQRGMSAFKDIEGAGVEITGLLFLKKKISPTRSVKLTVSATALPSTFSFTITPPEELKPFPKEENERQNKKYQKRWFPSSVATILTCSPCKKPQEEISTTKASFLFRKSVVQWWMYIAKTLEVSVLSTIQ